VTLQSLYAWYQCRIKECDFPLQTQCYPHIAVMTMKSFNCAEDFPLRSDLILQRDGTEGNLLNIRSTIPPENACGFKLLPRCVAAAFALPGSRSLPSIHRADSGNDVACNGSGN
jgi:hypothetical protein